MMVAFNAIVDDSESFPNKLLALIRTASDNDLLDAISWLPHGRAIAILDEDLFMGIATRFFKVSMFRSFTRQLHLWGFSRVQKGPEKGAWWNPHFLRNRPDVMRRLVRRKIKGTKRGQGVEAPDFASMPPPESDRSFDDDGIRVDSVAAVSVGVPAAPRLVRSVSPSLDGLSSWAQSPRSVGQTKAETYGGDLRQKAGKMRNRVSIDSTQYSGLDDGNSHSHHILPLPPKHVSDEACALLSSDSSMDWSIIDELDELGLVPNNLLTTTQSRDGEDVSESLLVSPSGDFWDEDDEFRSLIGRTIHFS